jgi:hypothetical protein
VTATKPINVSIVVGRISHAQAVIDDLRQSAMGAGVSAAWTVNVSVFQVGTGPGDPRAAGDSPQVVQIQAGRPVPGSSRVGALAGAPGPVGVVGRLVRDNLESRRVAMAVFQRNDVLAGLRGSAVVVAADPSADRAVWQLRKLTGAHLVHGPAAMLHAIRLVAQG